MAGDVTYNNLTSDVYSLKLDNGNGLFLCVINTVSSTPPLPAEVDVVEAIVE